MRFRMNIAVIQVFLQFEAFDYFPIHLHVVLSSRWSAFFDSTMKILKKTEHENKPDTSK